MKHLFLILFSALFAVSTYAQSDVTTFLGIPVDGYKSEMRQKLTSKGFEQKVIGDNEFFEGEFNGTDVHIYIGTNNNKVYRLMICDANTQSEANIKIRFNKLVHQFENNKRYVCFSDQTLSDDVDISYEMSVHNKNFDAMFFQAPDMEKIDTLAIQKMVLDELQGKYTPEQLQEPTEEISQDVQAAGVKVAMELMYKKPVWFRISELYGEYYITMFYDNEYNHADGEDL